VLTNFTQELYRISCRIDFFFPFYFFFENNMLPPKNIQYHHNADFLSLSQVDEGAVPLDDRPRERSSSHESPLVPSAAPYFTTEWSRPPDGGSGSGGSGGSGGGGTWLFLPRPPFTPHATIDAGAVGAGSPGTSPVREERASPGSADLPTTTTTAAVATTVAVAGGLEPATLAQPFHRRTQFTPMSRVQVHRDV
jgi:hypothetical protein